MTMLIHVTTDNHIQGREPLLREVEASLQGSLARFAPQITRVEVHLSDENGKKAGENDKKCTLEARLAGLQSVAVSGNGVNLDRAISTAVDKLAHMLDHKLGKLGDRKGRTSYAGNTDGQP